MSIKRTEIINTICRKAGITRQSSKRTNFSKRELALLNSQIDLWIHREGKLDKAEGAVIEEMIKEPHALGGSILHPMKIKD